MLHCIDVETVWETKDVTPGQEEYNYNPVGMYKNSQDR